MFALRRLPPEPLRITFEQRVLLICGQRKGKWHRNNSRGFGSFLCPARKIPIRDNHDQTILVGNLRLGEVGYS